ncbi:hypothetical protein SAMN05444004_102112 [Jannaschia faecimaris]|uniref:Uncharacterized protein n=1 Tax=Jannaschia faecimaris TaxID=1244108 RepID=A0A1H3L7H8_9RHOB|nr:hypothetical protein SAMN05444004_102112 [Jannaschia faecimaris]
MNLAFEIRTITRFSTRRIARKVEKISYSGDTDSGAPEETKRFR